MQAINELEEIAPYPGNGRFNIEKTGVERKWSIYYGGLAAGRRDSDFYLHMGRLSPEYDPTDRKAWDDGSDFTMKTMWPSLAAVTFENLRRIDVPIFFLLGRHDTVAITPPGGAQKVSYVVSLLTSQKLNVVVLLDDEKKARQTGIDLARSLVLNDQAIVYVLDACDPVPMEADIKDVLDPTFFSALAMESHEDVLAGKALVLNEAIPRIERRYDKAFELLD